MQNAADPVPRSDLPIVAHGILFRIPAADSIWLDRPVAMVSLTIESHVIRFRRHAHMPEYTPHVL